MSRMSEWVKSLSWVWLFATPWTVAYQAPLSMGFSRQEYWSGLPFPSPGDLLDPGIEPGSPSLQADALTSEPPGKPRSGKWNVVNFRLILTVKGIWFRSYLNGLVAFSTFFNFSVNLVIRSSWSKPVSIWW